MRGGHLLSLIVLGLLLVNCKSVNPLCALFDDQGNCLKCVDRSYYKLGLCLAVSNLCGDYSNTTGWCITCVTGYMLITPNNGNCIKTPFLSCASVSSQGLCLSCIAGYTFSSSNCTLIPIANCLTQPNTTCTACKDRYYLNNNTCLAVKVIAECVTYSSTDGTCLSCSSAYTLSAGTCTPTPIPNCIHQEMTTCL